MYHTNIAVKIATLFEVNQFYWYTQKLITIKYTQWPGNDIFKVYMTLSISEGLKWLLSLES